MSEHGPIDVDDLADRLIEKRERLHYFIVTASAAAIAFSLGWLQPPGPTIPTEKKTIAEVAGVVLVRLPNESQLTHAAAVLDRGLAGVP